MDVNQKQDLSQILAAISGIAPMFGPIGMGVGAAAGLGSMGVNNSMQKQMQAPHLATFKGYADGGPVKVTQNDFQNQGKAYSKGTQTEESGRSILRKGARGQEVIQLQAFLKNKGMYKGEVDGIFGDLTEQAVKGYQSWYNKNAEGTTSYVQNGKPVVTGKGHKKVAVDGVVGDETRSALMYRQMPKEAVKKVEAPKKMGELGTRTINYNVTEDGVIKGEPDGFDPFGGAVILGLAGATFLGMEGVASLGGLGAGGLGAESLGLGSRIYTQMPKVLRLPKQIPTGGNTIPNPSNMIPRSFGPKTPSAYGTRIGYADGGMIDINSTSQLVDGDPNVKDSVYDASRNVRLDHNEVVKNDFVFSNRIKNPKTGNTFAKDAAKIERSTGKAEKKYKQTNDSISKKTVELNEQLSQILAKDQEVIATMMGKRDEAAAYANGGPITENPKYAVQRVSPRTKQEEAKLRNDYGMTQDGSQAMQNFTDLAMSFHPVTNAMSFLAKDEKTPVDYASLIPGVKAAKALGRVGKGLATTTRQAQSLKKTQTALKTLDYLDPINAVMNMNHYANGGPIDPLLQMTPMQRSTTTVDSIKRLDMLQAPTYGPVDDMGKLFNLDVPYTPASSLPGYDTQSSGSSHSKSKERFREKAYGGEIKGMDTGGPFDPLPGQPYMELFKTPIDGIQIYYDPYNKRQVMRNPSTGEYMPVNREYPKLPSQDLINAHVAKYPGAIAADQPRQTQGNVPLEIPPAYIGQTGTPYPYDINPLNPAPRDTPKPWTLDPTGGMGGVTPKTTPATVPATSGKKSGKQKPLSPLPQKDQGLDWKFIDDSKYKNYVPDAPVETIPYFKQGGVPMLPNDGMGSVQSMNAGKLPKLTPIAQSAATAGAGDANSNVQYTTGDYMQMMAAISRLGNFQRPEQDTPNLDLTQLSKNSYDVNPVLGRNNRDYQNALNNTSTSSPNLRRAIANQMYASKLNADSTALGKYQEMNNQAQTNYEDRLSGQRRFNASKMDYTQNLNAQNRGASMNARQAGYDQLGQVGLMLNKKKEGQAYIEALKIRYPDISANVLKDILGYDK